MSGKAYCTCIHPGDGRNLWNPEKEEWTTIAILTCCNKPCKGLWLRYVRPCENCFKDFSMPSDPPGDSVREAMGEGALCQSCAPQLGLQPPWRGWKWAAKQAPDWHPGYMPSGPSLELEDSIQKPLDNLMAFL